MTNPVLIELTRGAYVECQHAGAIAIARANGEIVFSLGNIDRPVYPRSAIKALQAIPLIETGAADHYGLGNAELALACASHSATRRHVSVAAAMLARAGLDEGALDCGAHAPLNDDAAFDLRRSGARVSPLHNNCSGKHAGMLLCAAHLGESTETYAEPEHPVQRRIHQVLAEVTGAPMPEEARAVDGCSVPNWAIPLRSLATGFARFITGDGFSPDRRRAAERIAAACWAEPELVAGPGRLDTAIMSRFPGKVLMKTGAEGVYCAALPELGLGIALKIDDGAKRASEAVLMTLLRRLVSGIGEIQWSEDLKNWRGRVVGEIRPSGQLLRATYDLGV